MKLGTKGKYAVMAMVDLAYHGKEGEPVSLSEIAARQALPLLYLEQLFNLLKKSHFVESVRGAKGGYLLSKPASQICISDILQAAGESIKATRCDSKTQESSLGGGCLPNQTKCLTHALWRGLEDQLLSYLQKITLEDVCNRRVPSKKTTVAVSIQPHPRSLRASL